MTNPTQPAAPFSAQAHQGLAEPPLSVMVVVEQAAHREALFATLRAMAPQIQLEVANSAFDALLRSARPTPVELLVLDMALDGAAAPALARHLARTGQATDVRVFGDRGRLQPGEACDIWAWSEASAVLQSWLEERRAGITPKQSDRKGP